MLASMDGTSGTPSLASSPSTSTSAPAARRVGPGHVAAPRWSHKIYASGANGNRNARMESLSVTLPLRTRAPVRLPSF